MLVNPPGVFPLVFAGQEVLVDFPKLFCCWILVTKEFIEVRESLDDSLQ